MYNSIYPININYRNNPYHNNVKAPSQQAQNQQNVDTFDASNKQPKKETPQLPASNVINISQILTDFKNTILAINAPQEVKDEVDIYLGLVDKESKKDNPSREIILSNLRNASKVSDEYIGATLGKQSNVVEGWIVTMFHQNINLKANPDDINPDFLLKFPDKAQDKINQATSQNTVQNLPKKEEANIEPQPKEEVKAPIQNEIKISNEVISDKVDREENIEVNSTLELSSTPQEIKVEPRANHKENAIFSVFSDSDIRAKELYIQAKNMPKNTKGDTDALNLLNEAIGLLDKDETSNKNIKAALHLERGKIFDNYDYIGYALRDYFEATKSDDLNLKANAFYKAGSLYDEFSKYAPALDNYLSSVAYSGEADNQKAQTTVLSKIATLYTKQFDSENTEQYTDLAIETAMSTKNIPLIAKTYSIGADNYQYLGEDKKALENYKNAVKAFTRCDESYEQMAYNYEQAAVVMERLGNLAKAEKLQAKAQRYYQIAQRQQELLEQAS